MAYRLFKNIPFWEYCGPSVRVLGWKGLDIGKTVKKNCPKLGDYIRNKRQGKQEIMTG